MEVRFTRPGASVRAGERSQEAEAMYPTVTIKDVQILQIKQSKDEVGGEKKIYLCRIKEGEYWLGEVDIWDSNPWSASLEVGSVYELEVTEYWADDEGLLGHEQ